MPRWKTILYILLLIPLGSGFVWASDRAHQGRTVSGPVGWTLPERRIYFVQTAAFPSKGQAETFARGDGYILQDTVWRCLAGCWFDLQTARSQVSALKEAGYDRACVYERYIPARGGSGTPALAQSVYTREQALTDAISCAMAASADLEAGSRDTASAHSALRCALVCARIGGMGIPDKLPDAAGSRLEFLAIYWALEGLCADVQSDPK